MEIEKEMKTIKYQIEENSVKIQKIVDQLVTEYNKQLDDFMNEILVMLGKKDELTNTEVEMMTLKIPVYMYFGVNGMENLGIQFDNAKAIKANRFNDEYINSSGTINDKTAYAENETIPEALMIICYERAYKKLKSKMGVAEQLCNSTRKVLQKRIAELDILKIDGNA